MIAIQGKNTSCQDAHGCIEYFTEDPGGKDPGEFEPGSGTLHGSL
jgi:hypothetical protein